MLKKIKHPWSLLLLHNYVQVALQQLSITLKISLIEGFNHEIKNKASVDFRVQDTRGGWIVFLPNFREQLVWLILLTNLDTIIGKYCGK